MMLLKKMYKKCRNRVTTIVRKEYNDYFLKKFKDNAHDITKIWRLTDEVIGKLKKKATTEVLRKHFPQSFHSNVLVNDFNNSFIDEVHSTKVANAGSNIPLNNE